jgi:Fungal chitosanase of glycosyl hydrolase group 75
VWGDTNGGCDTGEASISLATACFGDSMNGDNGYTGHDVLYLAFTGAAAKPGASGADWCVWSRGCWAGRETDASGVCRTASDFATFEASLAHIGDALVAKIGGSGNYSAPPASTTPSAYPTSTPKPATSPSASPSPTPRRHRRRGSWYN